MENLIKKLLYEKRQVLIDFNNKLYKIDSFEIYDETFYFLTSKDKNVSLSDNLLYFLECEADCEEWKDDLYISPMSRIGGCDIKVLKNDFEYDCKVMEKENKIILKAIISTKNEFRF